MTTPEMMAAEIEAIKSRVPAHLFVTHFDASDANGHALKARKEFLGMAREALTGCGVNWFDPSDYVKAFGQTAALDQSTASLTHYTPAFEKLLASNWWHHHIEPMRQSFLLNRTMRERIKARALEKGEMNHLSATQN